ncbi:DUF2264 domain-containing protein [Corallincola spongiicola]|uniref:DUF2264 domain-containing protein n=1 Tax=Corallincola spongiicola TaxID=2520508 RepID=A0ABY1WSN2_9GAMM|nr:DUF2264 domain-containing protein [Corallincola spongiicola]TAA47748.1 DUF2264 domain-containing protein [Corallincola spongiicola]
MITARIMRSLQRWRDAKAYRQYIPQNNGAYDKTLQDVYCSEQPFTERVSFLCRYFVTSFFMHANETMTRCYFEGAFSYNDRDLDAIEGCTRMLPFLASVSEHYGQIVEGLDGRLINIDEVLTTAFSNGTDPESNGYWGNTVDYGQLICEAADVALAIWISRKSVWDRLEPKQRSNILQWLDTASRSQIVDNNWHLFRFTILVVIEALDPDRKADTSSYERIKSFYVGDGWFTDGEGQHFDYYNAWAFHYTLYWLNEIQPELDPHFIKLSSKKFCKGYKHFFSPLGVPFFGRSLCYRTAAPAPLVASVLLNNDEISPGLAKRAFDQIWRLFIDKKGIKSGLPTQGYFGSDLRFLDEYSGTGSSLWGLRSLILLLRADHDSELFLAKDEKLPVERFDFEFSIDSIQLQLSGDYESHDITATWIFRDRVPLSKSPDNYGIAERIKEILSQRPQRPKNEYVKNKLYKYICSKPIGFS